MALKAYMSHPALGQLHPTRGLSPSQPGDSDPDSSSSISPVERNYDSRLDLSPPRPSFQSQEQSDDLRTHSRAQSLHDMTYDHAQVTRRSRQAPPANHISRASGRSLHELLEVTELIICRLPSDTSNRRFQITETVDPKHSRFFVRNVTARSRQIPRTASVKNQVPVRG
jgi:hypothetical protein